MFQNSRLGRLIVFSLVAFILGCDGSAHLQESVLTMPNDSDLAWTDATDLTLVGRYFGKHSQPYVRLPDGAEKKIRGDVWILAHNTAGFAVAFESNASVIAVNFTLASPTVAMFHMPATGVSGAELWAEDPRDGTWRWVSTAAPHSDFGNASHNVLATFVRFTSLSTVRPVRWLCYFPLYNGVTSFRIGVPAGEHLGPCSNGCKLGLDRQPIVWYGTSITQGACASKPGDAYTNAVARALRWPVANFGFSGNCFYEPEVMDFLLQIDAPIYIVDCNPNFHPDFDRVYHRARNLLLRMQAARPNAFIVLATATPLAGSTWGNNGPMWLDPQAQQNYHNASAAVFQVYKDMMQADQASRIRVVDGSQIYTQPADDTAQWSMTVTGAHPTSLGMERFTRFWTPVLRDLLSFLPQPRTELIL